MKSCSGLHCPGCGDGSGPAIGIVIALVIVAIIASKAKAIDHAAAEVGHILVLTAITAASIAVAAGLVTVAVVIHRRLNRIERATGRMQGALNSVNVPPALANPYNGHRVACQCPPCAIYWDTPGGRIAYLMAAGQPVPDGLWRAAERQDRQLAARTIRGEVES